MLEIIEAAKNENEEDYNHIYLGYPRSDDDESVIKRSHVMSAIDAHIKLKINISGSNRVGFDVADSGEDSCAAIFAHGSLIYSSDLWKAKEDELLKSCMRVWNFARDNESEIIYDAIGVGAHCGAKFNELNEGKKPIKHSKYFAGGSPIRPDSKYGITNIKNRDFFCNIKSQSWWTIADRFRNTYNAITNGQQFDQADMIFIDSSLPYLDKLIDELCTPKKDFDTAGRVKVESKKDLAKRDIMSPNLADAFIMACQTNIKSGLLF
jgi:phage terminase large subunit